MIFNLFGCQYQQQQIMQKGSEHNDEIYSQIKLDTWSKFRATYAKKFKKQYDNTTFIILASISLVNRTQSSFKIISIGVGTKSLPNSIVAQNNSKQLISDMHAQILAIRGFKMFLCRQIKEKNNKYLIWSQKKQKYSLRKEYDVYLYCSQIFCGDCCINQQKLSFSGAKPLSYLKAQEYPSQKYKENILRTKPGRVDLPLNKRSAILSCSDLIAISNILGIQGKSLFSVITPVYINVIIIDGDQSLLPRIKKGVNVQQRLSQILHKPVDLIKRKIFNIIVDKKQRKISSQFYSNIPQIIVISKNESRNREGFDLCGIFDEQNEQWLNGKTGLPEGSSLKNYNKKGKKSIFSEKYFQNYFQFYKENEFSFKYDAVLDRIKLLFGQWIQGTGI